MHGNPCARLHPRWLYIRYHNLHRLRRAVARRNYHDSHRLWARCICLCHSFRWCGRWCISRLRIWIRFKRWRLRRCCGRRWCRRRDRIRVRVRTRVWLARLWFQLLLQRASLRRRSRGSQRRPPRFQQRRSVRSSPGRQQQYLHHAPITQHWLRRRRAARQRHGHARRLDLWYSGFGCRVGGVAVIV